jgi:hypothetical protein
MTTFLFALLALVALRFAMPRMADQSAHAIRKTRPNSGVGSYVIADGVTVYAGMLAQLEGGYVNHWDETGKFLGIIVGGDDRAKDGVFLGETSDTPPPEARVDESGVILMHVAVAGTPTQAKVGDLVYSADSNVASLTMTDTTNPPVGRLVRYRSATDCDVHLFSAAEWAAGDAGATWAS